MKKHLITWTMCLSLVLSSTVSVAAAQVAYTTTPAAAAQNAVIPGAATQAVAAQTTEAQSAYAEGEALAIVREKEPPQVTGQAELLAEVGPKAVKAAMEEWNNSGAAMAEVLVQRNRNLQIQEEDTFAIWSVTDRDKSTEQLIQDLYEDPNVIAAEPNYLTYATDEEEEADEEESSEEAGEAETAADSESSADEEPDSNDVNEGAAGTDESKHADTANHGSTSGEAATDTESAAAEEPDSEETGKKADLTLMQWYTGKEDVTDKKASSEKESATYTTPLSPTGGYSLEVPGWQEGRTNKDVPENASGTICIMDTGIDTDHPDLKDVLYEFTPEQQAKYGCGKYGFNASGDGRPVTEQKAVDSHGTHVAGIIAADWDGDGVSGIANGVKIFSVNVFGGDGTVQETKSIIKGFQFLINCAQEVNLKAVNCSWGTVQTQFVFSVMVDELGRKGVNTVIAAGNRYCDLDNSIDFGSMAHSEYAIVVDAASMDGNLTDFSCWGQDATDVLAPGGGILSSVTQIVRYDLMDGEPYIYEDNTRFYPEVTASEHLLSIIEQSDGVSAGQQRGIERFEGENPGVRFFDQNPALSDEAKEMGEIDSANGFDDKRTAAVRLSELKKEERRPDGSYSAVNGYVYMAIPVTSGEEAKWIGVKAAMSDGFKPSGGIDSITCAGEEGEPVEIDAVCSNILKKGLNTSATYNIYQCQWVPLSYNVDGFIEASNELHVMIREGLSDEKRRNLGLTEYRDPGEITGLYEWEDQDQTYVIARIGIGEVIHDSRSYEVTPDTTLYIDNVAVGDESSFTGAYAIMSGTSMAAPTVTGCLGVIAKDEPESASMTDAELAQAARERAAKLLAAVDYDENLSGICRTGGRVNLHGQSDFVRKAPLITRAEVKDQVLNLEGWYFGKKGTITIDGSEVEAGTREDQNIEIPVRSLPNGSHVVAVTNEDGAVNRAVFSVSYEEAEGRKLFEKSYSVPVNDPVFIEDHCDRLYGSMAVGGGKVYTMALSAKYKMVQGFWCYDIAQDSWSRISFPEGFDTQSVPVNSYACLNDRLYLCGSCNYKDEDGEDANKSCLWSYEPYGDFWEQLDILMPTGSGGICVLHDELFVVDGNVFGEELEGAKLEGAAPNSDGDYMSGFYKVDLAGSRLIRVEGKLPNRFSSIEMKLAASKDRIYIYGQLDYSDLDPEEAAEAKRNDGNADADDSAGAGGTDVESGSAGAGDSATGKTKGKTPSEGILLRAAYDASENKMTVEELTDTFNKTLGEDLRCEYEYKMGDIHPGEHFAIAGLDDGVAIIGSSVAGEDLHIIYDTDQEAVPCDRTTSYHKAFDPIAAYCDGTLYVIGYNTTEPDVMYFRSQVMTPRASQDGSGNAGQSGDGSGGSSGAGLNDPKVIGGMTIGLFAVVVLVLTLMKRKPRE